MRKTTKNELQALYEFNQRKNMALSMFRPMEHQEEFFRNWAREFLFRGGVRCVSSGSKILTPYGSTKARDLQVGDTVAGPEGDTPVVAKHSFRDDGLLVSVEGRKVLCTLDHPLKAREGWRLACTLEPGMEVKTVDGWQEIISISRVVNAEFVALSTGSETYIAEGFESHNSGKSTCCAARFAATAMGIPITLNDGTEIEMRQPWQKDRCLRMWVIGYDSKHIGQTIHRLLFQEGLFKVIRDKQTGLYRTYQEWNPEDKAREDEARPSPPLIPSRYIVPGSFDWENKKNKEFNKVVIQDPVTGNPLAEIFAYSSKADPKAGDPVDVIWIDEAIEYEGHYSEWLSRLIDTRGNLFWSSWPNVNNEALQNLSKKALQQKDSKNPLAREVIVAMSQNKTMSKEKIDEALGMFNTEADRQARDLGQYVTDQLRMYPLFHEDVHSALRMFDIDGSEEHMDEVSRILRASRGTPPASWTRELIVDPGTSSPAALFVAVPPPQLGVAYVVYDELVPGRADAAQLAALIKQKMGGNVFHRFIIDAQAGRQQSMGYSWKVQDNYSNAFRDLGIASSISGHGFVHGTNNVGARIGALQEWMHIMSNGLPKLRIYKPNCPKLCEQLRDYKKARINKEVRDDRPHPGQTIDAAVCLEYWASSHPQYVRPKAGLAQMAPGVAWYMRTFGKKKKPSSAELGAKYFVDK